MPSGTVYVGRPTRWGNPFQTASEYADAPPVSESDIREGLRGRDLACWCPPDGDCHADYLLIHDQSGTSWYQTIVSTDGQNPLTRYKWSIETLVMLHAHR